MTAIIIVAVICFIGGFLIGRNNPNLKAVNDLLAAGKAVVDATGKTIKKL